MLRDAQEGRGRGCVLTAWRGGISDVECRAVDRRRSVACGEPRGEAGADARARGARSVSFLLVGWQRGLVVAYVPVLGMHVPYGVSF